MRLTFSGYTVADRLDCSPSLSVTVSVMRYLVLPLKSCPLVGIVNVPLVTPVRGVPGCTWPSWRKSIFQVYALAGNVTPSISVAVALKEITSPALNNPPSEGVVLKVVMTGGFPTLMVNGVDNVEFTPSDTVSRA